MTRPLYYVHHHPDLKKKITRSSSRVRSLAFSLGRVDQDSRGDDGTASGPVIGATIGIMYWLAITMLSVPWAAKKPRLQNEVDREAK